MQNYTNYTNQKIFKLFFYNKSKIFNLSTNNTLNRRQTKKCIVNTFMHILFINHIKFFKLMHKIDES